MKFEGGLFDQGLKLGVVFDFAMNVIIYQKRCEIELMTINH